MGYWPESNHTFLGKTSISTFSPTVCELARLLIAGNIGAASGAVGAANTATFVPVQLSRAYLVNQLWWANGAGVAGTVDVGVYDRNGERLVSAAANNGGTAITQSGASVIQSFNVTDTWIGPGTVFLAHVASTVTTATYQRATPNSQSARGCGMATMASALPLPTTATFSAPGSGTIALYGFTQLGVI